MCGISARRWRIRRFTTDEVIRFILDIPGNEENMFREKGDAEFDLIDVSGSDSDYPEQSVEEVNEPSKSRGRGGGRGREMQRMR